MSSHLGYGGQAVLEGVMIRGKQFFSVAARAPDGNIQSITRPINMLYSGMFRKIPLIRGVVILIETLVLGITALNYSANVALEKDTSKQTNYWSIGITMATSLVLGITIFFILPLLLSRVIESQVDSEFYANVAEGGIRLIVLFLYILAIGRMKDIKRVFCYHGAEHMTIHAFEKGDQLTIPSIRKYPTAHPRCGTAFLLTVVLVSIIIFTLMGRPNLTFLILSRILLIPIIAGLSYEIIKLGGKYSSVGLFKVINAPSLLMQSLTTSQPDDQQIEVAIHSLTKTIEADNTLESSV